MQLPKIRHFGFAQQGIDINMQSRKVGYLNILFDKGMPTRCDIIHDHH